jgi:hypothetical protein
VDDHGVHTGGERVPTRPPGAAGCRGRACLHLDAPAPKRATWSRSASWRGMPRPRACGPANDMPASRILL